MSALPIDPLWPRAGDWPTPVSDEAPDAVLLGVPAWRTSLSPTGAGQTPAAIRAALRRYSPTLVGPPPVDLNTHLRVADAGDVDEPDGREGEARVRAAVAASADAALLIALGGDNSTTYAVAQGRGARGLITLDAHFDLRDGESNGSPVRRLLDDGLDPRRVVQIGIADFANSAAYARRAADAGITVITLDDVRRRGIDAVAAEALRIATGTDVATASDRHRGAGTDAASGHQPGAGAEPASHRQPGAEPASHRQPGAEPAAHSRPEAVAEPAASAEDESGAATAAGAEDESGAATAAGAEDESGPTPAAGAGPGIAPHASLDGIHPGGIHLDIDVDVCDRSVAPGCPASVPGGLAAWELRALVRRLARDPHVTSADIVEVDATADAADARTVRLAALCVLELLAGLVERR
ncbi:formiminoglutamase [Microbacterium sp. SORGH_AS 1204]|uniref:arginase family protein n=1 Tax=Microbacterium sp. SORGH_AS_1204 TaxID=3041785 RepID=UPI002794A4E7|nr:arginase family protein [Microbacterium sp. SORGH_AS_1204]MDQ1136340.1 formiminoglutamase [Microbacterium sp. SORGH_AS_1204]